jgi:7,8-dihydroneopterin aldolase/epimerase/oxygenase
LLRDVSISHNRFMPTIPLPLPSADAADDALDLIFIEGLRGSTVIGIHASELQRPQPIVIDVHAGIPRTRACVTDRIGDTLDYGVLRTRLQRLLAEHRVQLLEAFAECVADVVLGEFGARWVRVKVVKPHKFDDVDAVGVQIERHAPARARAGVLHLIGSGMVPEPRR